MRGSLLFIDQYAGLAGAERILLAVATAPEIRRDWEVTFALPEKGWLAEELARSGVPVVFFPGSQLHYGRKTVGDYLRYLFKFTYQVVWFRRLVRKTGAQVVYMSTPRYVLHAILASWWRPTRIVYHVQCTYRGIVQHILRVALRSTKVGCVIANSHAAVRWAKSLVPKDKPVVWVPNWTRLLAEREPTSDAGPDVKLAALSETSFRFAVVGRIARIKGHDLFLRAAHQLLSSGAAAEFFVVGSGEHFEPNYAEKLRAEFGNERGIHFVGHVDNIAIIYAQVSCVVVPSREEAFGLVAIEAMSLGVPIIVSDVGELPEIAGWGNSGLIFRSDDLDELVGSMRRIMDDPILSKNLSVRASERVNMLYSADNSLSRIGELLRRLRDNGDLTLVRSDEEGQSAESSRVVHGSGV